MKLHLLLLLALMPGLQAMSWGKKYRPKSIRVHAKAASSSGALESSNTSHENCVMEEIPLTWEDIQGFFVDLGKDRGRILIPLIDNTYSEKIGRSLTNKQIIEVIEYALSHKIGKPNSEIEFDEAGNTPLHIACHFGKLDVILLLLEHGAKITALNKKKETPFELLLKHGIKAKTNAEVELIKNILQKFLEPVPAQPKRKPIKE